MYDPKTVNWLNPNIQYLFNSEIIEYDIKSAGFSISKAYHLVPDEVIRDWEHLPKDSRNRAMGLYRRDHKDYSATLTEMFAKVRGYFFQFNDISDSNVVCVKNDAIFTVGYQNKLKYGVIEFRPKNIYHAYIRIMDRIEIMIADTHTDIKGMNQSAIDAHRLYLLALIEKITSMIESKDVLTLRYFMRIINQFKNGELDDQYYLEFNSKSNKEDPLQVYQNVMMPLLQIILKECT